MKKFKLAIVCSLALAGANAMACYTVYDRSNQVVYNAQTAPVDMSRPIHETLPAVFPGGHMVFALGGDCPREAALPAAGRTAQAGSVLLTDRRTAEAMHLPHTILASGAAMVNQRPAGMSPGVVVAQSAVRAPVAAPVALAAAPARTMGTVITEMRDPPMTVVQGADGSVVVSELRR
ncbi:MAG: hypothetical protein HYX47_17910 [Burkholderiales bacterium]|nr:hypothetical protein [Burkholderiales bacterium]